MGQGKERKAETLKTERLKAGRKNEKRPKESLAGNGRKPSAVRSDVRLALLRPGARMREANETDQSPISCRRHRNLPHRAKTVKALKPIFPSGRRICLTEVRISIQAGQPLDAP
jgi:hypothetical protein